MRLADAAAALSISDAGPRLRPGSPPRRLQPAVPQGGEAGESSTRRGGPGRKCAGRRRRAGGGEEQARPGRGGAPRSSVAHSGVTTRKRRPLTAWPSFRRRTHRRLLHRARRPPPPSAPSRPREASAHTARPRRRRRPAHTARPRRRPLPRASPPSPRLHAPPQLSRARAAAALMDPAGCAAPQASAGGDDDRYPNGQSHCHPRDSPAAVVASARTHAQSTLSPLPPFLPSLPFSLASPLTTPSTASQSYRLTPRMRKPLPSSAAFRPYACALTAHPENRINTSARSRQSLTAANPP